MLANRTTDPAIEPITLVEAQTHLILTGQDDYLNGLIKAVRTEVERYLNRSLILQTWKAYSDHWCREMVLPFGPVLGVTSLKYFDQDNTERTVSTSDYWVDTIKDRIVLAFDFTPPMLMQGRPSSIVVEYTAGYKATGTDAEKQAAVPDPIKHGMKILMTDYHEHRGQYVIGNQASKLPEFVTDLLHPYRLYDF